MSFLCDVLDFFQASHAVSGVWSSSTFAGLVKCGRFISSGCECSVASPALVTSGAAAVPPVWMADVVEPHPAEDVRQVQ